MKYKLTFLLLLLTIFAFGQEYKHYCLAFCYMPVLKGHITAQLDLGDVKDPFNNKNKSSAKNICYIVDEDGDLIKFNSEADFLNYMSKRGWQLEQFWDSPAVGSSTYFLSKTCTDDKVHEGIKLKYEVVKK